MLALPAVSCRECVRVLFRMGYQSIDDHNGVRFLERGERRVSVPHAEVLDPDVLARILHDSGTTPYQFLDVLSGV